MIQSRKPHPDALASEFGWFLPKTGELLVSIRGLSDPVKGYKPNTPFILTQTLTAAQTEETDTLVQVTEVSVPDVEIVEYTTESTGELVEEQLNFLAEVGEVTMPTTPEAIGKVVTKTKPTSKK